MEMGKKQYAMNVRPCFLTKFQHFYTIPIFLWVFMGPEINTARRLITNVLTSLCIKKGREGHNFFEIPTLLSCKQ